MPRGLSVPGSGPTQSMYCWCSLGVCLEYIHCSDISFHHYCFIEYLMDLPSHCSVILLGAQDHVYRHPSQASSIVFVVW